MFLIITPLLSQLSFFSFSNLFFFTAFFADLIVTHSFKVKHLCNLLDLALRRLRIERLSSVVLLLIMLSKLLIYFGSLLDLLLTALSQRSQDVVFIFAKLFSRFVIHHVAIISFGRLLSFHWLQNISRCLLSSSSLRRLYTAVAALFLGLIDLLNFFLWTNEGFPALLGKVRLNTDGATRHTLS